MTAPDPKALAAEIERLRDKVANLEVALDAAGEVTVELERFQAENNNLSAKLQAERDRRFAYETQRDAARAVLAETPENVERLVRAFFGGALVPQEDIQERIYEGWQRAARQALAAQRAAAALGLGAKAR